MDWFKTLLLTALFSTFFTGVTPEIYAADWNFGRGQFGCRRGDRIHIQDLDMTPDPVVEGQRIRAWRVRLQYDGRRECETEIFVRDGRYVVGHVRDFKMRPGVNELEIPATNDFRFHGRELCFNVSVDLEGSRQEIDADRRFCAAQRTMWSMRERGDRDRRR